MNLHIQCAQQAVEDCEMERLPLLTPTVHTVCRCSVQPLPYTPKIQNHPRIPHQHNSTIFTIPNKTSPV